MTHTSMTITTIRPQPLDGITRCRVIFPCNLLTATGPARRASHLWRHPATVGEGPRSPLKMSSTAGQAAAISTQTAYDTCPRRLRPAV
jgi:hypothetical protein